MHVIGETGRSVGARIGTQTMKTEGLRERQTNKEKL